MSTQIDHITKDKVINFLVNEKGFTVEETSPTCYWDLTVRNGNGKEYRIEIKSHTFPSTKFDDHTFEESKLNKFLEDRDKFEEAYLISFYTDNVIKISNIFTSAYTPITRICPKTTSFGQNQKVIKKLIAYTDYKTYTIS